MEWTTTHGHYAQMGAIRGIHPDGKISFLDPDLLGYYIKKGWLDPEELRLKQKDIEDRSKGDSLSKGFMMLQMSWFILECLARLHRRLPLTQLEAITLAYAVMNSITYAFWWHKPLNVHC